MFVHVRESSFSGESIAENLSYVEVCKIPTGRRTTGLTGGTSLVKETGLSDPTGQKTPLRAR